MLRLLLSLDYVLEHPHAAWLPTEDEKVKALTAAGIAREVLPRRLYQGAVGAQYRYLPHKLPVALDRARATSCSCRPRTRPRARSARGADSTPRCGRRWLRLAAPSRWSSWAATRYVWRRPGGCSTRLAVGRGDGSYTRLLTRLAKLDLLAIDDWMLAPLRDTERRDLTEVIEDRAERASTLIASQLPVTDWHAVIGDPNQADAICDRLLHDAHRIDLKGRSMRRTHDAPANGQKETT